MASGISLNSALGYTSALTKKTSASSTTAPTSEDLLQKVSNATVSGGTSTASVGESKSIADQFLDYMNMSDEEKLKYSLLNQMGISKDDYDAMSPEQKADVDKKLADRIAQIEQAQSQGGAATHGVAAKLQTFADSAQANEKKIPLIDFSV